MARYRGPNPARRFLVLDMLTDTIGIGQEVFRTTNRFVVLRDFFVVLCVIEAKTQRTQRSLKRHR